MEAVERALPIAKELIPHLHFDRTIEVLESKMDRRARNRMLYFAMILGNNYKSKVRITFESAEGIREVDTTVWMATEETVMLKGGVSIPVGCILKVEF